MIQNILTAIAGFLVLGIIIYRLIKMFRRKGSGGSACSGCSGCSSMSSCNIPNAVSKEKDKHPKESKKDY